MDGSMDLTYTMPRIVRFRSSLDPSKHLKQSVTYTGEPMKIICVEEHTSDRDLLQAGQPKQKAEAGYFTEVGTCFNGSVDDGDDKLPTTVDFRVSGKLLPELDGGRLALMDRHGIDMQILSFSDAPQNAPLDRQIQLSRQANNRLAEAVRAHPSRFGGFRLPALGTPRSRGRGA